MERRLPNEGWSLAVNDRFGPNGRELASFLAGKSTYPGGEAPTDLMRVAQWADLRIGRESLRDYLQAVFPSAPAWTRLQEYLASFERPLLITTTNYDERIEAAFDAVHRPYQLVVQTLDESCSCQAWRTGPEAPERMSIELGDVDVRAMATIYKIHGSTWPSDAFNYVISEDDYLRFLQRMMSSNGPIPAPIPLALAEPMATRSFLFIGYGLEDWNLRLLLFQLKDVVAKQKELMRPSWAVMHDVDAVDKRLWMQRQVELFEIPLAEFVDRIIAVRDGGVR